MKKYNRQLFWGGLALNILAKAPILLIAVVLGIIGIWKRPLLIAALCIAAAVIVWSVAEQIMIKFTVENNKDENFEPFADAMTSDNWQEKLEKATAEKKTTDIDKQDDNDYNI